MDIIIRIIADGFVVLVGLLALYKFYKIPRSQWLRWGILIILAGVTSYLAAKVAGHFFQPETLRPFEKLAVDPGAAYLNNPGFPSDHALFATFLTLAVWFSTKDRKFSLIMLTLTIVMCIGRVLALVHTPLDVIGGMILALVGTVWYGRLGDIVLQYIKPRGDNNERSTNRRYKH